MHRRNLSPRTTREPPVGYSRAVSAGGPDNGSDTTGSIEDGDIVGVADVLAPGRRVDIEVGAVVADD